MNNKKKANTNVEATTRLWDASLGAEPSACMDVPSSEPGLLLRACFDRRLLKTGKKHNQKDNLGLKQRYEMPVSGPFLKKESLSTENRQQKIPFGANTYVWDACLRAALFAYCGAGGRGVPQEDSKKKVVHLHAQFSFKI